MSESDIKKESLIDTPPEIADATVATTTNLLPEKSRIQYKRAYDTFDKWRKQNHLKSCSEQVLLTYFQKLAKDMKPSSLWAIYSMLRSTIGLKESVDISKYAKLLGFLRRTGDGYKPQKSKVLTPQQIREFLSSAPDEKYLFTKVGIIFGIKGACRREELTKVEVSHVNDLNSALLVRIPDPRTKTERQFVITDSFYQTCKKYMALRPPDLPSNVKRFFLNYQRGKCTKQPVGINKFGTLAREVADFLKLPNTTRYTGHFLRRSSTKIISDAGALKWRSTTVAEGYVDHSLSNKIETTRKIANSVRDTDSAKIDCSESPNRYNHSISSNFGVTTEANLTIENNDSSNFVDDCANSATHLDGCATSNYLTSNETHPASFDDTTEANLKIENTDISNFVDNCANSDTHLDGFTTSNYLEPNETLPTNFDDTTEANIKIENIDCSNSAEDCANSATRLDGSPTYYLKSTEKLDAGNFYKHVSFINCKNVSNLTFNLYVSK